MACFMLFNMGKSRENPWNMNYIFKPELSDFSR